MTAAAAEPGLWSEAELGKFRRMTLVWGVTVLLLLPILALLGYFMCLDGLWLSWVRRLARSQAISLLSTELRDNRLAGKCARGCSEAWAVTSYATLQFSRADRHI